MMLMQAKGGIKLKNMEIRMCMLQNGLKHWMVAKEIGIDPATLSVWLRHELTGEKLTRVQEAIDRLTKKDGGGNG